nr:acyltransferase [Rhodopirellula sp. JC639]
MIDLHRLVQARLRARWWAVRGASLGPKVSIGSRGRVDYPRGISIAIRVTVEQDVWFKLVDESARLSIGEYSFIGRGSEFDVVDHVSIGANTLIAPGTFITDHSHNCESGRLIREQGCSKRPVRVGDDVWIGARATILSGVTVGNGAVIGAGAVVRADVPSGEIWAGVPAQKIRER